MTTLMTRCTLLENVAKSGLALGAGGSSRPADPRPRRHPAQTSSRPAAVRDHPQAAGPRFACRR